MLAAERFWAKVDPCRTDGCWLWNGWLDHGGYGQFRINKKLVRAHSFLIGSPPIGFQWDHICHSQAILLNICLGGRFCIHRRCVNPDHLELVTPQENSRRSLVGQLSGKQQREKTRCPQGHPYDLFNTYRAPKGDRRCRICKLVTDRRWKRKRKLAIS